jgi:hypothetical protein
MANDDIQLEPPVAKHADVTPAVEDRSYIWYIGSALFMAIAGGFVLATLLPLIETGTIPGVERVPRLIQAHGWAQLQGWAGLFVAGMAVRLIPRFAGRRPIQRSITVPILVLLLASVIVRTVAEPFLSGAFGEAVVIAAGASGAAGMAGVAAVLLVTLARGRRRGETWEMLAWFGAAWWAAWAVYTLVAAIRASEHGLLTPRPLDDALTWIVMFGVVANFIWAVQSRSVPVFFGRKVPRLRMALGPAVVLNAGVALIAISQASWPDAASSRIFGVGFVCMGAGSVAIAPMAGALWGEAHRLRPKARSASRVVLAANWWAIVAGLLLIYAGGRTAWAGSFESQPARDAARHAFGVGVITMLIPGMAQLIAPVFAIGRAESRTPGLLERLPFWLLLGAAVLRVGAALTAGHGDDTMRLHVVSTSGALAWLGLVLFAITVFQSVRSEPRRKAQLMASAMAAKERHTAERASKRAGGE